MALRLPETEIFILPHTPEWSIVYAPLKGELCLIDKASADELAGTEPEVYSPEAKELIASLDAPLPSLERATPIERTARLSLIPNNICNLHCSYCYSAAGRNNSVIADADLDAGLRWFVDKERSGGQPLSIFITGGGEPLATWSVTSKAISLARELADRQGISLHIALITNGTLLSPDKISFLKDKGCSVGVSFDVLPDVQNANRGHYEVVDRNIRALLDAGIRTMVNSTIIPSSVERIEEMVGTVADRYPGLAQYTVEPATGTDLFGTPEAMRSFYDVFFTNYFKAKDIARRRGVALRFTFDDSLRGITTRHCPGKFALTPSGRISACHLVSSPAEPRFEQCVYGRVADGKVDIDRRRFDELYSRNVGAYPECADCVAKWSCGGECFTRRSTYAPEFMAEVCRFNRAVVERLIKEEISHAEPAQ